MTRRRRLEFLRTRGIHTRLLIRLTGAFERLATTERKGRLVDPAKIERLLARWVSVRREQVAEDTAKRRSMVHWHVKEEAEDLARQLDGVYLLRTNMEGTTPAPVWEDDVTLVRVEEALETLKRDLRLRPICHHWERRTEAHARVA